jgi:hypothetical protein
MKTAVEWLANELTLPEYGDNPEWVKEVISKAKEMEKQHIIDAYEVTKFGLFAMTDKGILDTANKSGKQYYNETFKQ